MSIIRQGFESADLDVPVVLPTLNLDFANSQSLDKRITFSRGSIGTRVNRNGLIETIPANLPRFDFDPISGECKGLLIEESRTNLITYSDDFGDASWSKSNINVTTNTSATTAPDGSNNAEGIIHNLSGSGIIKTSGTFSVGSTITVSIFVKKNTSNFFRFEINNTSNVWFNLNTGVVATTNGSGNALYSSSLIIPYPNGWYRCVATFTTTTITSTSVGLYFTITTGNSSYIGNSGYLWGAQVEAGAFPTSYIPTIASTVTRSADNADMTGTNFSSWYNQTEGTFFYNGTLPFITNDTTNRVPYGVSNGFSFANSMYVVKGNTSLGLSFNAINNNLNVSSFTSLPNMTSSKIKIASSVAPNNFYSCGYGGVVNKSSRTSAAIPPVTKLTLGKEPWNTSPFNPIIGCINKFAYYPKALSPAELQYLTQ